MPPFVFYLITIFILNMIFNLAPDITEFITSLFFLRIYWVDVGSWFTGHIWSLCIEEHFYIILSTLFAFLCRKNLLRFFFIYFICISLWKYFGYHYKHISGVREIRFYLKAFAAMDFIVVGAILAFYYKHSFLENSFQKIKDYKLISLLFFALFPLLYFQYPFKVYILPFYLPFLVVLTCKQPEGYIQKGLENPFIRYIGKISYSLYLWQQLFFPPKEAEFIPWSTLGGRIPHARTLANRKIPQKYISGPSTSGA